MKLTINITSELLINLAFKMSSELNQWQKIWSNNQFHRNRVLNKARQVGASWYFSLEAVNDACLTGRNKIFLGDLNLISNEIAYFCNHVGKLDSQVLIKQIREQGRVVIWLSNGAKVYFISSEKKTFSAVVGDIYIPEWSWNIQVDNILKISMAITTHHRWRRTYYSTRSNMDNASVKGVSINNDKAFFIDRVNLFEANDDYQWCYEYMKEKSDDFTPLQFAEMYLCQFDGK